VAPPAPVTPVALAAPPAPPANAYAGTPSPVSTAGAVAKPKRRVWPWILGIGGVLVVLAVVAVVVIVMVIGKAVAGPKGAAEDFNKAYFSGDCETYLVVTTSDFRDSEYFPATCADATAQSFFPTADAGTFSIKLDGVETSNSTSTVTGTVSSPGVGETPLTYHLIKVDGKWLVDSIE